MAPAVASASAVGAAPSAVAVSGAAGCPACWGATAPTISQAVTTVVNHLFNSAFEELSRFPANPIADLFTGAVLLIRRSLFFIPTGVVANQKGTELTVSVNTGSVAYFRRDGVALQVSGLPSFRNAAGFAAATVSDVTVTNPGNSGCAGFVVESGTAEANLHTSSIDAIRFAPGAAFGGTVDATLKRGSLSLRDGVSGLAGVTVNARVILDGDVNVDAGIGDATFADAVDGAGKGRQSLTVTALGTTAFEAPVGGHTPLKRLITQGISPLKICESPADGITSVPLHFLPEYALDGHPQVKYGIDVAVGDNPSQVYEFDTGATGFYAGFNPEFWQGITLGTTAVTNKYGSGITLSGPVTLAPVTLGTGSHTVSTGPINIVAVIDGTSKKKPMDFENPDVPPMEDRFFGDFGANFKVRETATSTDETQPLTSPLFQFAGVQGDGFVVQLGPIGVTPELTVGVNDELRKQFPYAIPVTVNSDGGTYPVSDLQVLEKLGFQLQYAARQGQDVQTIATLPTLIDTGTSSTAVRTQSGTGPFDNGKGQLEPGTTFIADQQLTGGHPPLQWTFVAGDNIAVNEVKYQGRSDVPVEGDDPSTDNVNTGLNLFNYFDVMFDVEKQMIRLRPTGGQSTVILHSVTTTGDQIYRQNAELGGEYTTGGGRFSVAGSTVLADDTRVDAGCGDVTFSGTVDSVFLPPFGGPFSLTINSSGATTFVREVGTLGPLASLTTDRGGSVHTAAVVTQGEQRYGDDAVTLNGLYAGSSFRADGAVTMAGPTEVTMDGGGITFGSSIDAQQGRGFRLTLAADGGQDIRLEGDVGALFPLGGLRVEKKGPKGTEAPNATTATTVTADGSVNLDGSLGFADKKGLVIDDSVTADFSHGGVVGNFEEQGIDIGESDNSTISGFTVSGNKEDGIRVTGAIGLTISDNVIFGNTKDGILAKPKKDGRKDTKDVRISHNTVFANGAGGIHLEHPDGGTVEDNVILDNRGDGIQAGEAAELIIRRNTVSANAESGVDLKTHQGGKVEDNTVDANGADGILLTDSREVRIEGNTVAANAADGLQIDCSSGDKCGKGVTIVENTVTANAADGIQAVKGTDITMVRNVVNGNGSDGILLNGANDSTLSDNTVRGNAKNGVTVDVGTGNAVLKNSIFQNGTNGISLQNNGNADQPTPALLTARFDAADGRIVVTGSVAAYPDYHGRYQIQVFFSPLGDAPNVQARQFLGSQTDVAAGDFSVTVPGVSGMVGNFVTVTATPVTGPQNTSELSNPASIGT